MGGCPITLNGSGRNIYTHSDTGCQIKTELLRIIQYPGFRQSKPLDHGAVYPVFQGAYPLHILSFAPSHAILGRMSGVRISLPLSDPNKTFSHPKYIG